MYHYYVNRNQQPTGEHEVHKENCPYAPHPSNRIDLGWCSSDFEALAKARKYYLNVDGCRYCCPSIHRR